MGVGRSLKRVLTAVAGAALLVVGVVLLVLPGPGLLLVLAGLLVLSSEFRAAGCDTWARQRSRAINSGVPPNLST